MWWISLNVESLLRMDDDYLLDKSVGSGSRRRAGRIYKKQSHVGHVESCESKYFTQPESVLREEDDHRDKSWIPPRSPYALVQEDLYSQPWQLLVGTIFLTKTSARVAIPQLHRFLAEFPRARDLLNGELETIRSYLSPLGLDSLRAQRIVAFSKDYLDKDWDYPIELTGIGKYGNDSFRMFCVNEWRQVSPDDIPLTMYRNWLLENAHSFGI